MLPFLQSLGVSEIRGKASRLPKAGTGREVAFISDQHQDDREQRTDPFSAGWLFPGESATPDGLAGAAPRAPPEPTVHSPSQSKGPKSFSP